MKLKPYTIKNQNSRGITHGDFMGGVLNFIIAHSAPLDRCYLMNQYLTEIITTLKIIYPQRYLVI